jgi:hypothetical protein
VDIPSNLPDDRPPHEEFRPRLAEYALVLTLIALLTILALVLGGGAMPTLLSDVSGPI